MGADTLVASIIKETNQVKGHEQPGGLTYKFKSFPKCPLPGNYASVPCNVMVYIGSDGKLHNAAIIVSSKNYLQVARYGGSTKYVVYCNKGGCPDEESLKALN